MTENIYSIFPAIHLNDLVTDQRRVCESKAQLANREDETIVISRTIYGDCVAPTDKTVKQQDKDASWWLAEDLTKHYTNEIVSAIEGEEFGPLLEPKATANGAKTWQDKVSKQDPLAIRNDIKAMYDEIKHKLGTSLATSTCKRTLALPSKTWAALEAEHAANPKGSTLTLLQNEYQDLKIVALPDLETKHGTYAIFVCDDTNKLNAAYYAYKDWPQVNVSDDFPDPRGRRQFMAFARVYGLRIINPDRVAVMKGV